MKNHQPKKEKVDDSNNDGDDDTIDVMRRRNENESDFFLLTRLLDAIEQANKLLCAVVTTYESKRRAKRARAKQPRK